MINSSFNASSSSWSRVNKRLLILFLSYGLLVSVIGAFLLAWSHYLNRNRDSRYQAHSFQSFASSLLNGQLSKQDSQQLLSSYRSDLASHKEHDHWIDSFIILDDKLTAVYASQRSWVGQRLDRLVVSRLSQEIHLFSDLTACLDNTVHSDMRNHLHDDSSYGGCYDLFSRKFSSFYGHSYLAYPISVQSSDPGLLDKRYSLIVGFDRAYFSSDVFVVILKSLITSLFAMSALLSVLYGLIRLRFLADIKSASEEDYLTNLANRSSFTESSVKRLSLVEVSGGSCVLVIVDIDYFKNINDTCGHQCGDYVLSQVAGILASALRPVDLVGRLGGEEFALLIECSMPEASKIIERIRLQVELEKCIYDGRSVSVTISAGVADSEDFGYNFDFLYAQADKALYQAKEEGRNCVRWARKVTKREGWDPGSVWDRSFGMDEA